MFKTLATICKDNWQWRKQIGRLAIFELIKKSRGAALGWVWLFVKPLIFITVFWFALSIGLRQEKAMDPNDPPYFLWLVSGIIPWFYMRELLSTGSYVLHRYNYLVTKIKFPLSGIPTFFNISALMVHLGLMIIVFIIYFVCGMQLDLYLLQIPVLIIVMFIFFNIFATMASQISAISKDFYNLIQAFITPLFWLSGVIFPLDGLPSQFQTILLFNPITFFANSFRDALYYKTWVWENPQTLVCFGVVFLLTLIAMLLVYKHLHEEVPDVL